MAKSVFISSTSLDLKRYRKVAIEVCQSLGFEPVAMENFEAMGVGATEGSKRKVRESDLYIGIIAHRYGYIEDGYDRSVTEIEFDYAGERGLDRLCFLVDPRHPWPKTHYDKKNPDKLAAFRGKVEKSVIRSLFTTTDDFREKLTQALVNWQEWRSARSGELHAILATLSDDVPNRPERLIGREALVTELHSLLDKGKRVLLQGFGGIGKTAVAAHVAAERVDGGDGPVIWLRAGTEDRDALLAALAVPFNAQQTLLKETSIANQARVIRLLLMEHQVRLVILDDVWNPRALTQLLNINVFPSGMPILVTSRSRHTGLTRLDVGKLDRRAALELLAVYGDPDWVDDADADALCHKLGDHSYAVRVAGLTLALDGLTPAELLARISAAPWKLAAPEGEAEEGRASVEELLNTSLFGLDAEARAVFLAFGAFFTSSVTPELLGLYLQSAVPQVEDALNRLQRRGLAERLAESQERVVEYRTHDLAYSYARAQVSHHDHGRALDACLAYLERYHTPNPEHFAALRSELDNFVGAANWAMTLERYADVQKIANWLYRDYESENGEGFLHLQGYTGLATNLLNLAVTASEALKQPSMQAQYLGSLGSAYRDQGQIKNGIRYYRQSLKIYRELSESAGEGVTLGRLGIAHRLLGQSQQAIEYLEQALTIARQLGNQQAEGINLANLGIAYRMIGQIDRSLIYLEQALAIARQRDDLRGESINLGNIGDIYREQDRLRDAITSYERALAIARQMGDRRGEGINLGRLGDVYRAAGDYVQATAHLEQALATARETGDKRGEAINLGRLGDALRDQEQLERAVQHHERALLIARQMDDRRGEGYGLADLGIDFCRLRAYPQAVQHFQNARVIFESLGMKHRVEMVERWLEEAHAGASALAATPN